MQLCQVRASLESFLGHLPGGLETGQFGLEADFLIDGTAANGHDSRRNIRFFVKTRIVKLLAAACCFCCCGCESVRDASFTSRLWQGEDYVAPSPDPKLAISRTSRGILVQYDALYEHNGNLHRRAYYLEPNLKRVATAQKPVFVDLARVGPQTAIPILPHPTASASPECYAVCSSNLCTFTIYRGGKASGSYDLPVFKDVRGTATQVALTPLAVTGDVSVVAVFAAYIWAEMGAPPF